jgi:hypothetical protein
MAEAVPALEWMSPEHYVRLAQTGNAHCPVCRSQDLEEESCTQTAGFAIVSVISCEQCRAIWDEIYTLTKYANLRTHKDRR